MYTAGNMRYTGVAWKEGIRTLTLVVGFLIRHYTCPYFSCVLHEAKSALILCEGQVYGTGIYSGLFGEAAPKRGVFRSILKGLGKLSF